MIKADLWGIVLRSLDLCKRIWASPFKERKNPRKFALGKVIREAVWRKRAYAIGGWGELGDQCHSVETDPEGQLVAVPVRWG